VILGGGLPYSLHTRADEKSMKIPRGAWRTGHRGDQDAMNFANCEPDIRTLSAGACAAAPPLCTIGGNDFQSCITN
jgi:hypothetical protein